MTTISRAGSLAGTLPRGAQEPPVVAKAHETPRAAEARLAVLRDVLGAEDCRALLRLARSRHFGAPWRVDETDPYQRACVEHVASALRALDPTLPTLRPGRPPGPDGEGHRGTAPHERPHERPHARPHERPHGASCDPLPEPASLVLGALAADPGWPLTAWPGCGSSTERSGRSRLSWPPRHEVWVVCLLDRLPGPGPRGARHAPQARLSLQGPSGWHAAWLAPGDALRIELPASPDAFAPRAARSTVPDGRPMADPSAWRLCGPAWVAVLRLSHVDAPP